MLPRQVARLFAVLFVCSSTVATAAEGQGASDVLSRGTVNDSAYVNDYFGIQLTLPKGWIALNDDELAAIPDERIGGAVRALRAGAKLQSLQGFPLTMLLNPETGENVLMIAGSLDGNPFAMPMVAAMLHADVRRIPDVKTVGPIKSAAIAGKTFRSFDLVSSTPHRELTQNWYVAEFRGYAVVITITTRAETPNPLSAVLDGFAFATPGVSALDSKPGVSRNDEEAR